MTTSTKLLKRLLLGSVFLLPAVTMGSVENASAQALERFQQGINQSRAKPVKLTPQEAAEANRDDTSLVSSMRGVVIVHEPGSVNEGGTSADGVVADDELVPASVVAAAEKFIGGDVSLATLDDLTRAMVIAYRDAGRPVVNVVVPPQDISNGVIQIIAVVGRLGETTVEGETDNPEYYTEGFGLVPGDVIEEGAVLDQLRWKSRRFHRQVNAIYAPGSDFSLTDIAFSVDEGKPWSIFAGVDNTGNENSIGEYRAFTGFIVGDLWGLDHELSYQFTTSEDFVDALNAHVVSYTLPVASRTDLQVYGSYVESENDNAVVGQSGKSHQIGANFISQIPYFRGISSDARYGFVYKKSNSDIEFGGANIFANEVEIGNFYAQVAGNYSMKNWHRASFSYGIWFSPGDMFSNNDNAAIGAARAGATADYVYIRTQNEHTVDLPNDFIAKLETQSQWTNDRLPTSEQIYLGGLNTIRGFDENTVRGDTGAFARVELYSPRMQVLGDEAIEKFGSEDSLRFYGFFDVGQVDFNGTAGTSDVDTTIAGAGVGFTYQVGTKLSLEAAYGWNVIDDDNVSTDDGQFHFRAVTRF